MVGQGPRAKGLEATKGDCRLWGDGGRERAGHPNDECPLAAGRPCRAVAADTCRQACAALATVSMCDNPKLANACAATLACPSMSSCKPFARAATNGDRG